MAEQLNVVALISGGKDSLFSILHCRENNHKVVALANLFPPHDDDVAVDDIDSFMYQTIGHAIIPLYSEALGLPLYRQKIIGGANNQHKSYGAQADESASSPDETESLVPLLQTVMKAQPNVNAVCTGAILSDYQRTRVESVALRLGLIPLSFLWQFPSLPPQVETALLQDMSSVGQDSRIIKVASGGLDQSYLWKNVAEQRTVARLSSAAARFGTAGDGAVLGEGGEFETLAVRGPAPVWKAQIVIDDVDRESVDGEAGTASLRLRKPRLEPLPSAEEDTSRPRIPSLLDDRFQDILNGVNTLDDTDSGLAPLSFPLGENHSAENDILFTPNISAEGNDAGEQMAGIMLKLSKQLHKHSHGLDDIVYTTIIMRDMVDFPAINAVYGKHFSEPNPPARVTIACPQVLPAGSILAVAASSRRHTHGSIKKGLHVQSRSYWAPANIGPYSQVIAVPVHAESGDEVRGEVVYIAGQIPLVPATMQVVDCKLPGFRAPFAQQAVLALQHLFRIASRTDVSRFAGAIAFIAIENNENVEIASSVCRQVWCAAHQSSRSHEGDDDQVDVDIWDLKNRSSFGHFQTPSQQPAAMNGIGESGQTPPMRVVRVDSLPRGVQIEWAAIGLSRHSHPEPAIPHLHYMLETFRDLTVG